MKRQIYIILIGIFFLIFWACENNNEDVITEEQQSEIVGELFEQNEYNQDLKNFALAVSNAVKTNEHFRKLIKKEALAKFDGDYDILLSHIMNMNIVQSDGANHLRSSSNYTVKDLLEESYITTESLSGGALRLSSSSIISTLSAQYPNLQVSVPVHAEDWEEDYIPVVAFVPSESVDGITTQLPGYQSDGSEIAVSAIIPPSSPVIVIGENERVYRPLTPMEPETPYWPVEPGVPYGPADTEAPPAPTNLTASQTSNGIALSWNQASGIHVIGYYIYRKSTNETNFSIIGVSNGYNNSVYWDKNTQAGITYYYKVSSYNDFGESLLSGAVSIAGMKPSAPTSFEARQYTNTHVELRWTTPDIVNFQKLQLYKLTTGASTGYQLYREFTMNDYDYFDNVTSGQKIQYRLQTVAATGTSTPKYDYIRVPYRNPAFPSSLKIKSITCNNELEGWHRGAPEFQIKVFGVGDDFKTTEIQSIYVNFTGSGLGNWDRRQAQDILIVDWQPDIWYQMYTFYVVEDDGGDKEITVSANANYKASEDLSIITGASMKTTVKKGEEVGHGFISYFDPINKEVSFTNSAKYGFYMTMGD
jgi:hypothetical protein